MTINKNSNKNENKNSINSNENDNKDSNKINISINLGQEKKKRRKTTKRRPRLTEEEKANILGGGTGNFATQTPANYLPKYSERSLGGGMTYIPQPETTGQRLGLAPTRLITNQDGGIAIAPNILQPYPNQFQQPVPVPYNQFFQQPIAPIPEELVPQNIQEDFQQEIPRVIYQPPPRIQRGILRPSSAPTELMDKRYIPQQAGRMRDIMSAYNERRLPEYPSQVDIFEDALETPVPQKEQEELGTAQSQAETRPTSAISSTGSAETVFVSGARPPPEVVPQAKPKVKKLVKAYIEKVGDNENIEGTNYYVSKKDGKKLTAPLYIRTGRGRNANKLILSGMTYGEYLRSQRQAQTTPSFSSASSFSSGSSGAGVGVRTVPQTPQPREEPVADQGGMPPDTFTGLASQYPYLFGENLSPSMMPSVSTMIAPEPTSLVSPPAQSPSQPPSRPPPPIPAPQSVPQRPQPPPRPSNLIPRPTRALPSVPTQQVPQIPLPVPQPVPSQQTPPTPDLPSDLAPIDRRYTEPPRVYVPQFQTPPPPSTEPPSPSEVDITGRSMPPATSAESLNAYVNKYPNLTPQQFEQLTRGLREAGVPFYTPPRFRGRVRELPEEVDINAGLPEERRPSTQMSRTEEILTRAAENISRISTSGSERPSVLMSPMDIPTEAIEGTYRSGGTSTELSPFSERTPPVSSRVPAIELEPTTVEQARSRLLDRLQRNLLQIATSTRPPSVAEEQTAEIRPARDIRGELSQLGQEQPPRILSPAMRMRNEMEKRLLDETTMSAMIRQQQDIEESLFRTELPAIAEEARQDIEKLYRKEAEDFLNKLLSEETKVIVEDVYRKVKNRESKEYKEFMKYVNEKNDELGEASPFYFEKLGKDFNKLLQSKGEEEWDEDALSLLSFSAEKDYFRQKDILEEAKKTLGEDNPYYKMMLEMKVKPTENDLFFEKAGKAQEEFQKKYYRPSQRPSSAGDRLRETLYQSKLDEVKQDLLDFDREYGFKYDDLLGIQDISKENMRRMLDRLLNRYGYSHIGADLYIKEFLDSLKQTDEAFVREIRRDYEDNIKGNVAFYLNKVNTSPAVRNIVPRVRSATTDQKKKELFLRTLTETNTLTSNFNMFYNDDFKESLFQQFCRENGIDLDNKKTLRETLQLSDIPYGARRVFSYKRPSSASKPTTPVAEGEINKSAEDELKRLIGETELPSMVEERVSTAPATQRIRGGFGELVAPDVSTIQLRASAAQRSRPRTSRELAEMAAVNRGELAEPRPPTSLAPPRSSRPFPRKK